jgi:hypothetical protein
MTEDAHHGNKPGRKNHSDPTPSTEAYPGISNDGVAHKSGLPFNQNSNAHLASQETQQYEERKHPGPRQGDSQSAPGRCLLYARFTFLNDMKSTAAPHHHHHLHIIPYTCCKHASTKRGLHTIRTHFYGMHARERQCMIHMFATAKPPYTRIHQKTNQTSIKTTPTHKKTKVFQYHNYKTNSND